MARAMLVGCGCRGRTLGERLVADGWAVRGTSRGAALEAIAAAGMEAVEADPDMLGTVTERIGDVTVLVWLMGAADSPDVNGPRLESLLEKLVDSPVRGFLFEGNGRAGEEILDAGAEMVEAAGERFRIPVAVLMADPSNPDAWVEAARAAVVGLVS